MRTPAIRFNNCSLYIWVLWMQCRMLSALQCCVVIWCRKLLQGDETFCVPEVIWDLTTRHVLTTDLVHGDTLDKMETSDQETRNLVCSGFCSVRWISLDECDCLCYHYGDKFFHSVLFVCCRKLRKISSSKVKEQFDVYIFHWWKCRFGVIRYEVLLLA